MRYWTTLLFTLLVCGPVWAEDAPAAVAAPEPILIKKATAAVNIDGVLDEACWKDAPAQRVDYIMGKTGELSGEPRMTVRYAWDDHYLYVGYEVFDQNLVAVGKDEKQGPPNNQRQGAELWSETAKVDLTEFFISFGDKHFFWELHHNALNQFNDVWCTALDESWPISKSAIGNYKILFGHTAYLDDEGPNTLATAVHLTPKADGSPSTVNDETDTDTGYTGELRLPLLTLGAPMSAQTWIEHPAEGDKPAGPRTPGPWKMDGVDAIIHTVCQNYDVADRYFHSSPTFKGGWFHHGFDDYLPYRLVEK